MLKMSNMFLKTLLKLLKVIFTECDDPSLDITDKR